MPTLDRKYDAILQSMEQWTQTAREEFEDIANWRDNPQKFSFTPEPAEFKKQTNIICHWIAGHHAYLELSPLQDIYDFIHLWHEKKSATGIADQRTLRGTMERAQINILAKVFDTIMATGNLPQRIEAPNICPVVINGQTSVIVEGESILLSEARFAVVKALVDAYPAALLLGQLRAAVSRDDPHERIKEIRESHTLLNKHISIPNGRRGRGYRIT